MKVSKDIQRSLDKNKPVFKIAVAGQESFLPRINSIINDKKFLHAMPEVQLSALLLEGGVLAPEYASLFSGDIKIYKNASDMFEQERDIRLVMDISRDNLYMPALRQAAPIGVTLLSSSAVSFICNAIEQETVLVGGGRRVSNAKNSFMMIINQLDEDVMILDSNGIVKAVNDFMLKRLDCKQEDLIGLKCSEIPTYDSCCKSHDEASCPWKLVSESGQKYTKIYNNVNDIGQMRYLRLSVFPLPAADEHEIRRVLFMQRDVTQVVQIEQRLQQSEKMAAIGELSTYIAHEIRNPLFAIGGFANALSRSSNLDEKSREKAKIILEESQRLDGILKSILNFANPVQMDFGDIDMTHVIKQTLELMTFGDTDRKIVTEQTIEPNLPKVRGNADLIKQCLINIIKNAQEAMPEGGKLTVTAEKKGHMVQIVVSDTGSGIAPDVLPQIFNPFFSTKNKGAGLGLAMSKKIIEDTGGKLNLSSVVGKGTTVTMLLLPALAVSNTTLQMVQQPGKGTQITVNLPPGS